MNPYKVLGVSETATPEEIRAAYLTLAKKYHPDKYVDNPLKDLANEKLKEINEAYEMLTKKKNASVNSSYQGDDSSYSGSGGAYSGASAAEFARARAFINQNRLDLAKQVLDRINVRNGEWYFLYGIVYLRQGWYEKAHEYIRRAYESEPNNAEYRNAYASINRNADPFGGGSPGGSTSGDCSGCDVCSSLLCADCCCECMGGDLIRGC